MTIPQALEIGMQHHQAGRLAEAEAIYRQILEVEPRQADALQLLGVIAGQRGRSENAVDLIRQAIALNPTASRYHFNLGNALNIRGQLEAAIAAYRRAVELDPDDAAAHNNLGAVLKALGQPDEAIAAYRRAIALEPDYADAHNNLGVALCEQRHYDEAAGACRQALRVRADFADAHFNLGNALHGQGQPDEAIAAYRRALELKPEFAMARNNLGNALGAQGRLAEAVAEYRRALEFAPDFVMACNNLGAALTNQGEVDEAIARVRHALDLQPGSSAIHSSLLAILQYSTQSTLSALFDAHGEFDRRHAAPLRASWRPHRNTPDPDRALRLGFISPHFAFHPVGHFLIRPLENLDRRQFEVFCYSDTRSTDAMNARLQAAAHWHDVSAMSDEQLCERIRDDRIDILFDLAGHTAGNRLLVFARKPAPIQITWMDYVGTTGLAAMDYLIADPHEIPREAERWYREKILRMPDDYICYDPPASAPPVGPLPALANGHLTFASFNIPPKISPQIAAVWARILHRVPRARLILMNRGLDEAATGSPYQRVFAEHGIASDRLELRGWSPPDEVLASYNQVDIALDTFPYNGGLTTCEALWMGVPVVTCPGETFASRHGLTHLSAAGATETIATTLDQYVDLAVALAADLPRLAAMRAGLRQKVAASPLCDGPRFATHLTTLLRQVWRRWRTNDE